MSERPVVGDRGQAVVLLLIPIALVATIALAVGGIAQRLVARSTAQVAADASALAGATGGQPAAARAAAVNGGELLEYQETVNDDGVLVRSVVVVDGEVASARASTQP